MRTARSLGLLNVARVAAYRFRVRAGVHPVQRLAPAVVPRGPFFDRVSVPRAGSTIGAPAPHRPFGWLPAPELGIPDWHQNVLTGARADRVESPWWRIPDFDPVVGDIKGIWEASRFDWVVGLAQRAALGEHDAADRLNAWLDDWLVKNPPYRGHNWKCGQEASIRVMHLAVAALVLRQVRSPRPSLLDLVELHLRRIAPTISYAIGQDNNHGTSEAAALFIGGSWLAASGRPAGQRLERLGRELLTDRAQRLIQSDGSFSQYSVTYHRLMLDTLSLSETWRRDIQAAPFAAPVRERASAATEWLRTMVDPASGDAPNLGANDGADLLPLTDAGYRDFRPSVQLAAALFRERVAYPHDGPWARQLEWLNVAVPGAVAEAPGSRRFDDGGFAVLRRGTSAAILRYPRFRFRPGHADALHLDLWVAGENLIRDGGTFSYADQEWDRYFTGARGHSSIEFDGRESMPRLGRFLWGDWLRPAVVSAIEQGAGAVTVSAAYADGRGASHRRRVELHDAMLRVTDDVAGFAKRATMRWRLRPGAWSVSDNGATDGLDRIAVTGTSPLARVELVTGWESLFYGRRTEVPVMEVEIAQPGTLVTEYVWSR
jgi:hypothetical protein